MTTAHNIDLPTVLAERLTTAHPDVLRELLAANLYWHRTNGATLCLEEGTGGVILVYAHSVSDLDASGFETVMQNFATQAERWTRRLAQAAQVPQAQAEPLARPGTPVLFG